MRRAAGGALALVLVAAVPAQPRAPATPDPVVALFRDGQVRLSEVAPSPEAWRRLTDEQRIEAAAKVAVDRALARAAEERGVATQAPVSRELEEAERDLLIGALRRRIEESVTISEAEVGSYLEAHRDQLARPRKVRLRNLFRSVPQGAGAGERQAAREAMEALRRELVAAPETFAEVARRESDSQTRFAGGLVGAVAAGDLRAELEEVAFGLAPGAISPVIETPEGFTLLQSIGVIEPSVLSEEEAKQRIRQSLRRQESERRWDELRAEIAGQVGAPAAIQRGATAGEAGAPSPAESEAAALAAALDELAADRGGAPTPEHDPAWRERAAKRAIEMGLAAEPAVREGLRERRTEILAHEEVEHRARARDFEPTAEDVRRFFDARKERFRRPPRYRLSAIRLDPDGRSLPDRTRAAERALAELRSGRSFADVAREVSDDPSADRGGELGWVPRPRLAGLGSNVLAAVSQLEPGQTGAVVQQDELLWIFRLEGLEPGRLPAFEEVAGEARSGLTSQRERELRRRIRSEVAAELDVRLAE